MNIKSEDEIKLEELDLEYDSYQQSSQISVEDETNFTFEEHIENKMLAENIFIKSGLTELEKESCTQPFKTLISDADEVEKDPKMKITSKSRPQTSGTLDHSIRNCHLENLCCTCCNFIFKSKDELKRHLKSHNNKKFNCAHCSYESKFKSMLKRHLIVHNVKLFKCSECDYECHQKSDLKVHILTHGMVKLLKCSECDYECNRKGQLKIHMLEHGNIKLFKCSECCYECNRKGDFNRHVLTHRKGKLFKCSECNYECNRKCRLKTHMLKHENIIPITGEYKVI